MRLIFFRKLKNKPHVFWRTSDKKLRIYAVRFWSYKSWEKNAYSKI